MDTNTEDTKDALIQAMSEHNDILKQQNENYLRMYEEGKEYAIALEDDFCKAQQQITFYKEQHKQLVMHRSALHKAQTDMQTLANMLKRRDKQIESFRKWSGSAGRTLTACTRYLRSDNIQHIKRLIKEMPT